MLDATDTETVRAGISTGREHGRRGEAQMTAIGARNRRAPTIAVQTRVAKCTGRRVTQARSRIKK